MKTKESRKGGESFPPVRWTKSVSDVGKLLTAQVFNCTLDVLDGFDCWKGKSFWSAKNRRNH
jgi:hypothetical protein